MAYSFLVSMQERVSNASRSAVAGLQEVRSNLKTIASQATSASSAIAKMNAALAKAKSTAAGMKASAKAAMPKFVVPRDEQGKFMKGRFTGFGSGLLNMFHKTGFGKKLVGDFQKARAEGGNLAGVWSLFSKGAGIAGMAVDAVFNKVTALIGALGAGAAISFVGHAQAFKENMMFSFKYIKGSAEEGAKTFDIADRLARSMGQKTSDVAESMRELMAGGFSEQQSRAFSAGILDLKAMNPNANVEDISNQLAQMKGAGKVLMEDLKPIMRAGINDDIMWQVLREMTGAKDQASLRKSMKSGKGVDSEIGIAAVLETIKRQGGNRELGAVAAEKAQTTVGGSITALMGQLERFAFSIDAGPVGMSIRRMSSTLQEALDPSTDKGKRLLSFLETVASFGADLFDRVFGGDAVPTFFQTVAGWGEKALPLVKSFLSGFGDGLGDLLTPLGKLLMALVPAESNGNLLATSFYLIGKALGWVGGILGWLITATGAFFGVLGVIGWSVVALFTFIVQNVPAAVGSLWNATKDVASAGWSFVEGFWQGIKDRWGSLVERVKGLAALIPQAVRDVLLIRSPSRVTYQLGEYTAQGFTEGLARGAEDTRAAAGGLALAGRPLGAAASSGGVPGGASSTVISLGGVTVNVHVHGAQAGDPHALAVGVATELEHLLENLHVEYGAGHALPLLGARRRADVSRRAVAALEPMQNQRALLAGHRPHRRGQARRRPRAQEGEGRGRLARHQPRYQAGRVHHQD